MMSGQPPGGKEARTNVLCLAGWWPGNGSIAGIFIQEHVRAIAERHRVVVVYAEIQKGRSPRTVIDRSEEFGFPVYRICVRTPVRRFGAGAFLLRLAQRKLIGTLHKEMPFTLVHVHVRTPETACAPSIAGKWGLPVIVTEHNSYYHLGIRSLPASLQRAERRAIRRWFGDPRIAAVMPVSMDLARVLHEDYDVPRERMTVVPNVAAEVFRPGHRPAAPPFRIALAAHWRPPKDPDVLITALGMLPPDIIRHLRVDVAGGGPDMPRFRDRCIQELPALDVHFHGQLEKPAIAALFQQAHLFVLPTTADNLPCVVIESLSCGTPVLSMAVNGVPELVNNGNGTLVPPSDPAALAEAIRLYAGGEHPLDNGIIAKNAQERYSRAAVAQRIEEVYRMVLVRRSKGR